MQAGASYVETANVARKLTSSLKDLGQIIDILDRIRGG